MKYNYPAFEPTKTRDRLDDDENNSKAIEAALLKYYPKYCRSLELDDRSKHWPVTSRIRQMKILSHFVDLSGFSIYSGAEEF